MIREKIAQRLQELSEESYRRFTEKLVPGVEISYGVRIPKLRLLAKEMVKDGTAHDYLAEKTADTYEEIMLKGILLGMIPASFSEKKALLQGFIPLINNWAVCDTTVMGLKIPKKEKEQYFSFSISCLSETQEFSLRFGIVMLLAYFIEEAYIDQVLSCLLAINHEGYYVKMAVAWAVSVCYIKFPEKTRPLIEQKQFDAFTHNKIISKICDSFRVSGEDKQALKKLRH